MYGNFKLFIGNSLYNADLTVSMHQAQKQLNWLF